MLHSILVVLMVFVVLWMVESILGEKLCNFVAMGAAYLCGAALLVGVGYLLYPFRFALLGALGGVMAIVVLYMGAMIVLYTLDRLCAWVQRRYPRITAVLLWKFPGTRWL